MQTAVLWTWRLADVCPQPPEKSESLSRDTMAVAKAYLSKSEQLKSDQHRNKHNKTVLASQARGFPSITCSIAPGGKGWKRHAARVAWVDGVWMCLVTL